MIPGDQDIPEQTLTNTIIKVVTGKQKKLYFVQGHGERDTTSGERDGYKAIADALGAENYTVEKLVLAQAGSVPDDAAVVIVAGPKTDFFPPEIDALKKYLDNAGKLLLEIDPPDKADSPQPTKLMALAHDWGMDVGNDIVVDASGMVVLTTLPLSVTCRYWLSAVWVTMMVSAAAVPPTRTIRVSRATVAGQRRNCKNRQPVSASVIIARSPWSLVPSSFMSPVAWKRCRRASSWSWKKTLLLTTPPGSMSVARM